MINVLPDYPCKSGKGHFLRKENHIALFGVLCACVTHADNLGRIGYLCFGPQI